jgi:hypothetical protein
MGRRDFNVRDKVRCAPKLTSLDELHSLQARVTVLADDDMVVHGNAERGRDLDDRLGHMDIGLRRGRIARGVVVQEAIAWSIGLNVHRF